MVMEINPIVESIGNGARKLGCGACAVLIQCLKKENLKLYILKIGALKRNVPLLGEKVVIRIVYHFIIFGLRLACVVLFLAILNLPWRCLVGTQEYLQY